MKRLIILLALMVGALRADTFSWYSLIGWSSGTVTPGSCSAPSVYLDTGSGTIYLCVGGHYVAASTTVASAAFSALTGIPSDNTNLGNALDLKANLASPTFSGTVILPNNTVTNAMLAGNIAASKLIGTDIGTVGNVTTGTWNASIIDYTKGGTGLNVAPDDTTMVGTGLSWQAKSLPDCPDTGGNHLNYATGSNAFSCGTSGGGGGGGTWGSIIGTLSNQTDLQNSLNLKANLASPTFTGTVVLPNSTVTNAMLAGSIDLATKVTGILPAADFPALTGNVTTTAGSLTTTIGAGVVTNAMLAGSIAYSKLIGTDIITVGTIGTGVWQATPVGFAYGGTGLSSASDDTTMVSNGTSWQAKALPNCVDSGGNHLNYTASSNAFSCGVSSGTANAGGSDTQVQFNVTNNLGGDAGFTYNSTTDTASLAGGLNTGVGSGKTGAVSLSGTTSGDGGWTVADVAGTSILYMLPTTNGTAGQVLKDNGTASCPTLASGFSTNCHQTLWDTLTLASADFANQGTTTTVLKGNVAGNPSFGAVILTSDVSGTLPVANGGTNLTAATDDTIMIGNGTTWQAKSIGDCQDGAGHLNYTASSNSITCGTAGGSGGGTPGSSFFTYVSAIGTGPDNTATATSLIGSASTGSKTIPANTWVTGTVLTLHASGIYSTPASPDNLTINVKCGSTVLGTVSLNISTMGASQTNQAWKLWIDIGATAGGAGGALLIEDAFLSSATNGFNGSPIYNSAAVAYDLTTSCALDLVATWAGAQAGQKIKGNMVQSFIGGAPITSVNGKTGAVVLSLASADFANQGTTTTLLHGNGAGNPAFGQVANGDIAAGAVDSAKLATANKTGVKSLWLDSPVSGDSYRLMFEEGKAITLTRVACNVIGGTNAVINLRKTSEATSGSGGTAALTSNLTCTAGALVTSSTFSSAGVAARIPVALEIVSLSGTNTDLHVFVEYTVD